MFNLKYLILLALISFCLQDKNCLVYLETCEDKYDNIGAGSVANCQYGVGNMCYQCKSGYVVSHDLTIFMRTRTENVKGHYVHIITIMFVRVAIMVIILIKIKIV